MANDAEIKVGVKLDTTGLNQQIQQSLNDIYANVGGDKFLTSAANKSWNNIPFYQAHNAGGNVWATSAYTAGMANDLRHMGYTPNSGMYQDTLIASSMRGLMPDSRERSGLLYAYGFSGAASVNNPGSYTNKIMEQNAKLMSMPFARDYINDKEYSLEADFQGMREKAVSLGLGRWTDENKHDASTFEFIDKQAEKLQKRTKSIDIDLGRWDDKLKGVLGTLTGIVGTAAKLGIGAIETGTKIIGGAIGSVTLLGKRAYGQTTTNAGYLPNDRYMYEMSDSDVVRAYNAASRFGGMDRMTFYNGITSLSNWKEMFKNMGQGNPLYASLLGSLDQIVSGSSNPMDAYIDVAQTIANNSMDSKTKAAFINELGIPGIKELVAGVESGRFSSTRDPFSLVSNPYYDAYGNAESLRAALAPHDESIKASMATLYNSFTSNFGGPFTIWWDDTLKNTVVPKLNSAFDSIAAYIESTVAPKIKSAYENATSWLSEKTPKVKEAVSSAFDTAENIYMLNSMYGASKSFWKTKDYNPNGKSSPRKDLIYTPFYNGSVRIPSFAERAFGPLPDDYEYFASGWTESDYKKIFEGAAIDSLKRLHDLTLSSSDAGTGKDVYNLISDLQYDLSYNFGHMDKDSTLRARSMQQRAKAAMEVIDSSYLLKEILDSGTSYGNYAASTLMNFIGADNDAQAQQTWNKIMEMIYNLSSQVYLDPYSANIGTANRGSVSSNSHFVFTVNKDPSDTSTYEIKKVESAAGR